MSLICCQAVNLQNNGDLRRYDRVIALIEAHPQRPLALTFAVQESAASAPSFGDVPTGACGHVNAQEVLDGNALSVSQSFSTEEDDLDAFHSPRELDADSTPDPASGVS